MTGLTFWEICLRLSGAFTKYEANARWLIAREVSWRRKENCPQDLGIVVFSMSYSITLMPLVLLVFIWFDFELESMWFRFALFDFVWEFKLYSHRQWNNGLEKMCQLICFLAAGGGILWPVGRAMFSVSSPVQYFMLSEADQLPAAASSRHESGVNLFHFTPGKKANEAKMSNYSFNNQFSSFINFFLPSYCLVFSFSWFRASADLQDTEQGPCSVRETYVMLTGVDADTTAHTFPQLELLFIIQIDRWWV